jgi:hypothetical protein
MLRLSKHANALPIGYTLSGSILKTKNRETYDIVQKVSSDLRTG